MDNKKYPTKILSFKEQNDRIVACSKHVTLSSIMTMTGLSYKRVATVLKLKSLFHLTSDTPADEHVSHQCSS
jgi:hypothetical protein